mmetsp:Transcript_5277/g.16123  ORF Transcript_5277/g.16123 Transcript_5277/m.16123 type:complete len:224 (+) Transcript_5277:927-1598(+)
MLAIRPHDRIKPEDILSHPWISGTSAPSVSLTRALEGLKELRLASLQKIVLQLMEPRLKLGCELAPLERLFSELDIKHDGAISRADLDKVLVALDSHGSYNARLASLFETLDLRGDGVVSLAEFRASAIALDKNLMRRLIKPAFMQMDIDSTGDIDATEVARALTLIEAEDGAPIITEAQAQALLDEFDLTHSGKLNLEEFEAMMMSERQPASSDEKDSEDKV